MMKILRRFYSTYLSNKPSNKLKPPSPNFFHPNIDTEYLKFLQDTIKLANEGTTLIAKLNKDEIQRSSMNSNFFNQKYF